MLFYFSSKGRFFININNDSGSNFHAPVNNFILSFIGRLIDEIFVFLKGKEFYRFLPAFFPPCTRQCSVFPFLQIIRVTAVTFHHQQITSPAFHDYPVAVQTALSPAGRD